MVVEPPVTPPGNESEDESCTVTIDGEPVATTVSPMASGDLSVALVIDTASSLTAQEFAAVRSGAAEFVVRLPEGARTMVVAGGGEPQVVAPLSADRAEALSAISALRTGGSTGTKAGTRLAAQSLETASTAPRMIIVYAHDSDEHGPSVEQLSEAVLRANAVVNVISTSAESIWPSVVDSTGGVVLPPTGAADIVQSYRRLATMLSEQYLVTFKAPDELPAMAQVAFQSGNQEYRTVVDLPDAEIEQAAPIDSSEPYGAGGIALPVFLVVAGLVLGVIVLLVLRARRRASVASSPPGEDGLVQASTPAASGPQQASTPPAPVLATPATENGDSPSNGAPSSTLATTSVTSALQPRSRRGSLSAAVQGRRSAAQALDSAPKQQVRQSPEDQQSPAAPYTQAQRPNGAARPPAARTSTEPRESTQSSGVAPETSVQVPVEQQHAAAERHDMKTVLTGSGDAEIELTKTAPGPAVVHIFGNSDSQHFAVRTLGTNNVLVMTMEPYEGARPLDWDGDESTGFKIWATGPWRIEVLPLSAIPTFTSSFNGSGNMVVYFTGSGSLVKITGNNEGQHFEVWAVSAYGPYRSLVDTTQPCANDYQISQGPQVFEVQATGFWTITVK